MPFKFRDILAHNQNHDVESKPHSAPTVAAKQQTEKEVCEKQSKNSSIDSDYSNLYPTSIFCLVSACIKMSRVTEIPLGRKVYRGLGNMVLGKEWFEPDVRGSRSGVELAFMSTTLNMNVALEYSGVKRGQVGTVFEFDVGAIDCGARLDSLSQYPGINFEYVLGIPVSSKCFLYITFPLLY